MAMSTEGSTPSIDASIGQLDQVILSLLTEREKLVRLTLPPSIEFIDQHSFVAPFSVPLLRDAAEPVHAFEHLFPGFWVGFEAASTASMLVRQVPKPDPFISPPDHHYLLELDIVDPGGSNWITLESQAGSIVIAEPYVVSCGVKARASRAAAVRFELSIPASDGTVRRVPLGTANFGPGFEYLSLSAKVGRESFAGADPSQPVTIIAFLPTEPGFRLELAFFRVFMSRGVL